MTLLDTKYTRFPWMGSKKGIIGKHKPNTKYFVKSLIEKTKYIYTPYYTKVPPIWECLCFATEGKKKSKEMKWKRMAEFFQLDTKSFKMDYSTYWHLSEAFDVSIDVYREESCIGGKMIHKHASVIREGCDKVAILTNYGQLEAAAYLIPNVNGKLEILKAKKCNTCCQWIMNNLAKHQQTCIRCSCGRSYKLGNNHATLCVKNHYDKKQRSEWKMAKTFKPESSETYDIRTCYFADLETRVPPKSEINNPLMNGKYVVYAAGVVDYQDEKPALFHGDNSIDSFCRYIVKHMNGTLWFFNGGRFDNFFLMEWFIKNKIKIESNSVLIDGTSIMSITVITKKGKLTLRDLCRFLPGSLAANCKAFGLSQSQSKTDFDHSLIKTKDDVEKYKNLFLPYLSQDVTSLRAVFTKYAEAIYQDYKIHVCKFMTGAQIAYAAFTISLKQGNLLYKTRIEDEENIRKAYRGGRVICGRPKYKIKLFDHIVNTMVLDEGYYKVDQELYDSITDHLIYLDVNSLYPAAQVNQKYPVGDYRYVNVNPDSPSHHTYLKKLKNNWCKDKWYRRIVKVDVTCPNDLMVPFLMSRNEEKETVQNLLEKKEEWYTGVELWAAMKIGYKVTRIYGFYEWKLMLKIYDDFVYPAYKRKQAAPRDTPIYTANKNLLNGLTGKFAQKNNTEKISFILPDEEIPKKVSPTNNQNITDMCDTDGELLGYYVKEKVESEFCRFPIQQSIFILAHSKRIMLKITKDMGILTDEQYAVLYGDTDSIIVLNDAFKRLKQKWIGEELGQLKEEVDGKIISLTVLGPKNYNLVYIDRKTLQIKTKTRCKGIPHIGWDYPAFITNEIKDQTILSKIDTMTELFDTKKANHFFSECNIKDRYYVIENMETKEKIVCKHIANQHFDLILNRKVSLKIIFGSMIRKFSPDNMSNIYIAPDYKHREMAKNLWWNKEKRIFIEPKEDEFQYPTAYPIGHWRVNLHQEQ